MRHEELIHEETFAGFTIRAYAAPEYSPPDDMFDDDGETAAAIRAGEYEWFMVRVSASKNGIELAETFLGGCCYRAARDFITENDYYADMRREVCKEARAAIAALLEN